MAAWMAGPTVGSLAYLPRTANAPTRPEVSGDMVVVRSNVAPTVAPVFCSM